MLQGIRVVEIGIWVAGPAAGGILADWGADVVKIEPPGGDPCRRLFQALAGLKEPKSPPFDLDNRGKRSIVADLRTPRGLEIARRLIAGADVFITNMRPDALARMGLDYESLAPGNDRLIYCSISGYGLRGPDRDRAAFDVGAFWARSGGADLMVPRDEAPRGIRGGFGDHVTALSAVSGIMGALYQRELSGRGQRVETSLLRAGLYCVGWDTGIQLRFGTVAPTPPRTRSINPVLNPYRSSDGRWFWLLGLEADRHWPALTRVIERPDLLDDERYASASARRHNAEDLIAVLDQTFASRTLAAWAQRFDAEDLWWAPVQTPEEVAEDPQVRAAGGIVEVPDYGGEGNFRAVATPVDFSHAPVGPAGPPPRLGEHTDAVLRELGLDDDEIEDLRESGAIGG